MPCSGDLVEMTEAERVNDMRLHRCGLRIHGIGTERRADHGTRGPAALWLCHEPCDGLSDVMRVWGIGGLERRHEVLEYGARNLAHSPVGGYTIGISGQLNVLIQRGGIGARLHQHNIDAELRHLVEEAVGERLDRKLAGAVDAEEGERHTAKDRANIDDQSGALS